MIIIVTIITITEAMRRRKLPLAERSSRPTTGKACLAHHVASAYNLVQLFDLYDMLLHYVRVYYIGNNANIVLYRITFCL